MRRWASLEGQRALPQAGCFSTVTHGWRSNPMNLVRVQLRRNWVGQILRESCRGIHTLAYCSTVCQQVGCTNPKHIWPCSEKQGQGLENASSSRWMHKPKPYMALLREARPGSGERVWQQVDAQTQTMYGSAQRSNITVWRTRLAVGISVGTALIIADLHTHEDTC